MIGATTYRAVVIAGACLALVLPAGPAVAKSKSKADLVVSSLGEPPASLAAGTTLSISDTVRNRRVKSRSKASVNGYFLSLDKFRDLSDIEIGSRMVPRLKAKKKSSGEISVTVPALTPTGSYRLLACADNANKVKERRETNNCAASNGAVNIAGVGPPDKTPPTSPVITATIPTPPANDNQPEVRGTGAEAGSTVRIYATADCSGAPIGTGTAATFNGSTGITVTVAGDRTTYLRATATDAASNVSPCSAPFAYEENSSLPVAPTITDTDPDSPANDNNPEVKGGGAEAGSTVRIYASADCSGAPIGTGSATAFNGAAGITVTVASNHTTNLRATATDDANNVSACSVALPYTEDSIAPVTPTITGPDSPARDTTPQVTGTGAEAGSTVRVYANATCTGTPIGTGSAALFGGVGVTATVPANTTTNLRATATDAAGNISGCSAAFPYTEDSTAPGTPTITDTDPDSPANDNNPEVKGSGAETGSTVRLYATACTGTPIGIGTDAQFEGAGITATVPANVTTNLRAQATDEAGNRSPCSGPFAYTEDSTPPAAPTITATTPSTSPASPANDTSPEVQGAAAAGSTVAIYATSACTGSALATGTAAQFGAGITVGVPANATTGLRATATDAAGNTSGCSPAFAYTEDSTAPVEPAITATTPASPAADPNPAVQGTAEAGSTVRIYENATCSGAPLASGSAAAFGGAGIPVTVPTGATTDLRATATDAAGNTSGCSDPFAYVETSP